MASPAVGSMRDYVPTVGPKPVSRAKSYGNERDDPADQEEPADYPIRIRAGPGSPLSPTA